MSQLPLEVLQIVFKGFSNSDLLKCQLTCKSWHAASTSLLYQNALVRKKTQTLLYARTIVSKPALGQLLKLVNLSLPATSLVLENTRNLLEYLLEKCPNIVDLYMWETDVPFWGRLHSAAQLGQLSKIQELPSPPKHNLESYVCTVLACRNTLRSLVLSDQMSRQLVIENIDFNAFDTLACHLHSFPNLRNLKILRHSQRSLSNLDEIIQACPQLVSLKVQIFPWPTLILPDEEQPQNDDLVIPLQNLNLPNNGLIIPLRNPPDEQFENERLIIPRPDIRFFRGDGEVIMNSDHALNYLMEKFPRLDSLILFYVHDFLDDPMMMDVYHAFEVTSSVLVRFFHYMSRIPLLAVVSHFKIQALLDAMVEFTTVTDMDDIEFEALYKHEGDPSDPQGLPMEFSKQMKFFSATFLVREIHEVSPHSQILQRIGQRIRKLKISNMWANSTATTEEGPLTSDGLQIDQDLQLCPNLKQLTISDSGGNFINNELPHASHSSLESLSLFYTSYRPYFANKGTLHLSLPKLTHLHLKVLSESSMDVINLPNTHLKTLEWEMDSKTMSHCTNWIFYLKLTFSNIEHFIMIDAEKLKSSTIEFYEEALAAKKPCLDITCLKIDILEIVFSDHDFHQSYAVSSIIGSE